MKLEQEERAVIARSKSDEAISLPETPSPFSACPEPSREKFLGRLGMTG